MNKSRLSLAASPMLAQAAFAPAAAMATVHGFYQNNDEAFGKLSISTGNSQFGGGAQGGSGMVTQLKRNAAGKFVRQNGDFASAAEIAAFTAPAHTLN